MRSGSLVLVHGAGSGPWIFDSWKNAYSDLDVVAVDLHADLDIAHASMRDYAQRIVAIAQSLNHPLFLCGWSMGGLTALMAAPSVIPDGLILLEASPPAEVQGSNEAVSLSSGTFDAEEVYGGFPPGVRARAESQLARDERKRGISVPLPSCPLLVIWGEDFAEDRGRSVVDLYKGEGLSIPGASHWDLVLKNDARSAIRKWINDLRKSTSH
jgi:pimeloyl-ACP methyl ester carboxylesterase